MSDTANSVDGSDSKAIEEFKKRIPDSYYPNSGFRNGYHDRMQGKLRIAWPCGLTFEGLPSYTTIWFDEWNQGYDAAEEAIAANQRYLVEAQNGRQLITWI